MPARKRNSDDASEQLSEETSESEPTESSSAADEAPAVDEAAGPLAEDEDPDPGDVDDAPGSTETPAEEPADAPAEGDAEPAQDPTETSTARLLPEGYRASDRLPGELTTPMRDLELEGRARLRGELKDEFAEQPYMRPYLEGRPERYRRPEEGEPPAE